MVNTAAGNPSKLSKHKVLELGGLALLLWALAVILLLFAVSRFNRARHTAGHEREQAAGRQLAAEHLTRASWLATQLLAGEVPVIEHVWDVVLQPGERALLEGSAGYSRYYGLGSTIEHAHAGARHLGKVGGARPAAAAGRPRSDGRAWEPGFAAAARWREQQQSRVVVTDRRLLCQIPAQGWLSFDHAAATAIQAAPGHSGVVLEYSGKAPVRLSGPLTTEIMVIVVWTLYGTGGLREHPALTEVTAELPAAVRAMEDANPRAVDAATTRAADRSADGEARTGTATPRLDLLAFVATRELVLAEQAAVLLGVGEPHAAEQLEELVQQGLASRLRLSVHTPTLYRITQHGAKRVDVALLPAPTIDLGGYREAVALPEL